jgi:ABC-type multidrug transport system fused ATPase/permease subunit
MCAARVESLGRRATRLVWRFAKAHPAPLGAALASGCLYAVVVVASTVVIGRVTDEVILPALKQGSTRVSTLLAAGAAIMAVALLRAVGIIGRRYFGTMASRRYQVTLRDRLTDHYLDVDLAYHRNRATGDLLTTLDNDVERTTDAMHPLPLSVSVVVLAVAAVVSLLLVDPILAVVGLALIPTMALLNHRFGRRMEGPAATAQQRLGELGVLAHESFDGAFVVKTLGREAAEVERFAGAAARLRDARVEVGRLRASFEPTFDLLPLLAGVAVVLIGAWRVSSGEVTTGQIVQVVALFSMLTFPLRVMGYFLEELPMAVVSLDRVDAVLAQGSKIIPSVAPRRLPAAGPLGLRVCGVTACHGGVPALDDVSFEVAPGEVVAVVGATASGKSTLCELLVRLADPDQGHIEITGIPLDQLAEADLRRRVALVLQEPYLFADTVTANVSGTDVEADGQLDRALQRARAAGFVGELPRRTDTLLGERGVTLSGGQRQRLALARALALRPGLLILDDATSAVDPLVEARILAGLRAPDNAATTTGERATLLVVAHRLSTIRLADRVLFLEDGRVAATGPHDELLKLPAYAALALAYERQDTLNVEADGLEPT